ncbi:MAG TPA: DUF484 family protein [Gammaproteobacteria bacterium]
MSQQKNEAALGEPFSEEAVAEYLQRRPDFFERHGTLLLRLKLPHETNGFTVSLIERQVSMLRQRNAELERQLKDLISVAKVNDALVEKIHQLSLRLLRTSGPAERLDQLETSLREDFGAERAAIVLFAGAGFEACARPGFVKVLPRDDPELKPFSAFIQGARARCGPLRDRQKAVLFDRDADTVASAAMLPLGRDASLGFLVIGSRDPAHFHPGKRMDFLNRIGELITVALSEEQARSVAV